MSKQNLRSVLLAMAVLLSVSSCGTEVTPIEPVTDTAESVTADETTESPSPVLPEKDYGGDSFIFLNGKVTAVFDDRDFYTVSEVLRFRSRRSDGLHRRVRPLRGESSTPPAP